MKTDLTYGSPEKGLDYYHRPGAYMIAIRNDLLYTVKTKDGDLLLPGGGIEGNETHEECVLRECLEETGYDVRVEDYICSADIYYTHPRIGPFHQIQFYYNGVFGEKLANVSPDEESTGIYLLPLNELNRLYLPIQRYAVEQCIEQNRSDACGCDSKEF